MKKFHVGSCRLDIALQNPFEVSVRPTRRVGGIQIPVQKSLMEFLFDKEFGVTVIILPFEGFETPFPSLLRI